MSVMYKTINENYILEVKENKLILSIANRKDNAEKCVAKFPLEDVWDMLSTYLSGLDIIFDTNSRLLKRKVEALSGKAVTNSIIFKNLIE
ncbi:MAG: hypothetical protein SVO01_00740 [Thermotogota bacterium]|nr:hypothetical protein [Thermotogota bacterium]